MSKHGPHCYCKDCMATYQRRGERVQEELMREFAADLGRTVSTFLASTPYSEWPSFCKAAFEHCKIRAQHAAQLYKDHLPQ